MRNGRAALTAVATCLVAAPSALAAFPPDAPPPGHGPEGNPAESVRANTPNDPDFDRCESDNAGGAQCGNVFGEQNERFGFAPSSTQATALYHNPTDPHIAQLMARNTLAGRLPLGQVPGASVDQAWKYTTGDPDVRVAILDTGIRWERPELRLRVALNRAELPKPQNGATPCTS